MKIVYLAVTALALVLPAQALAGGNGGSAAVKPNSAQLCNAQRTAMGAKDFAALYGAGPQHRNAFGSCVSALERAAQADQDNAAQACKAEQSDATFPLNHGGKTFAEWYGRNAKKADAYGNCVSQKAHAAAAARQQATLNAARSCKSERAGGAAAFRTKYGTNKTKSNAFARCVAANRG